MAVAASETSTAAAGRTQADRTSPPRLSTEPPRLTPVQGVAHGGMRPAAVAPVRPLIVTPAAAAASHQHGQYHGGDYDDPVSASLAALAISRPVPMHAYASGSRQPPPTYAARSQVMSAAGSGAKTTPGLAVGRGWSPQAAAGMGADGGLYERGSPAFTLQGAAGILTGGLNNYHGSTSGGGGGYGGRTRDRDREQEAVHAFLLDFVRGASVL